MKRLQLGLVVSMSLLTLWPVAPSRGQAPPVPPCGDVNAAALPDFVNTHGLRDFANPPEPAARPTSPATRLDLVVDYADLNVLGCSVRLRTYNGAIVGPTIRAKPGETIHLRLINKLPVPKPGEFPEHPQKPAPAGHAGHGPQFSFNITNLHTHGLNVAPQGPIDPETKKVPFESDNVLLELGPGEQQDYRIEIHPDHPAGTFWYHAHVHGATAVQLSSGMAGALIVEGGGVANGDLDTVAGIGRVKDSQKIFVLQQLGYDPTGKIETFVLKLKPTLVNGQLVPVIRMRPGEIQRWRFIHAGVLENVALALDGHPIHEVAADGITLGRSVPWAEAPASNARADNTLFLAPGYRSDILVQARTPEPGRQYFLRKLQLRPPDSIQAQERAIARAAATSPLVLNVTPDDFAPGQILAQLIIEGTEITDQKLPDPLELSGLVPKDLPDVTQKEIDESKAPQSVRFKLGSAICNAVTGICVPCPSSPTSGCKPAYQIDERQFSLDPKAVRPLKLHTGGKPTAAEWTITVDAPLGQFHPFHIHVNPFQVDRSEPNAAGQIVRHAVWKDTILVTKDTLPPLRTRYLRFTGRFVLHCHILQHEDQGMMQLVEITD